MILEDRAMSETHQAVSTAKIRSDRSLPGETLMRARQKGSILMGIIITMVVMATLGAGMVYLTTTSTFQELLANNHARAYYAAESGVRYANARIRELLPVATSITDVTALGSVLQSAPFTMGSDQFKIQNWTTSSPGGSVHVMYESVGTVGSGFLKAQVILPYRINPANQGSGGGGGGPGGGGTPSPIPALPRPASDFD